jgi:uncharacterized protein (DUF1330 family)
MKTLHVTALAIVAGAALGGGAIEALHAQARPPVYYVIDFSEIVDPLGWSALGNRTNAVAAQLFKEFGGQYLTRTDHITAVDGGPAPRRFVVIRFDSVEQAKAWYDSPTQKKVNEIRLKTTKSRAFLVEGL